MVILVTAKKKNRRLNARGSQVHFDDLSGEAFFLFDNKMCIRNNLNLILNGWKVFGSYLKNR